MQKIAASYVIKQIGDQLFAQPTQSTQQDDIPVELTQARDDFDGQVFYDEEDRRLGRFSRLHDVAVYVVVDGPADSQQALEWCLGENESRLFIRRDGDRITGLIYVPDPSFAPARVEGARADDV